MISKDILEKVYDMLVILMYALAAIGGVAYLFVDRHYVFSFAAIATTAMATPYLIKRIKHLSNEQ